MKYGKARKIIAEAIEQLDELSKTTYGSYIKKTLGEMTDAEMEKLEKEHEARMAKQERTAYMSPTMRYHLAKLRKLAKPAAKKQKGKKIAEALLESTKNAKSRYRKAVRALGKKLPEKIEPFKPMDNPFTKPFKDGKK